MSTNARRSKGFARTRARSAIVDHPEAAASYVLRTARALIGTTPAQLAAHMGSIPERELKVGPDSPVRSFEDLADVLRALTGWYEGALGGGRQDAKGQGGAPSDLDETVRRYLAMRSEWEHRESAMVTNAMNASISARQPVQERRVEPLAEANRTASSRRRALLVDDSADILVTIGSFLEAFDFDVVSASSGDDALRILLAQAPIDLLVTDYAMPGMTGKDLALEACRAYPSLRALIITGYPALSDLAHLPERVLLLAKPFRRAELSARLRQLFREARSADVVLADVERT